MDRNNEQIQLLDENQIYHNPTPMPSITSK